MWLYEKQVAVCRLNFFDASMSTKFSLNTLSARSMTWKARLGPIAVSSVENWELGSGTSTSRLTEYNVQVT